MMITELPKQPNVIIYRSPDKGDWRTRWYEWEDIIREAENNPALDDLIKQAEMVYALTR